MFGISANFAFRFFNIKLHSVYSSIFFVVEYIRTYIIFFISFIDLIEVVLQSQ